MLALPTVIRDEGVIPSIMAGILILVMQLLLKFIVAMYFIVIVLAGPLGSERLT